MADRQLFMRTLRNLHETLGTQFRIPMVSGRELDLHLLYIQVLCQSLCRNTAQTSALQAGVDPRSPYMHLNSAHPALQINAVWQVNHCTAAFGVF